MFLKKNKIESLTTTKPYFLPNVTGWEIYVGGWRSEYTNRLGWDIGIFKKVGQRCAWQMRHLGETAQNGVVWEPTCFYLVGSQSQDLKRPVVLKRADTKIVTRGGHEKPLLVKSKIKKISQNSVIGYIEGRSLEHCMNTEILKSLKILIVPRDLIKHGNCEIVCSILSRG